MIDRRRIKTGAAVFLVSFAAWIVLLGTSLNGMEHAHVAQGFPGVPPQPGITQVWMDAIHFTATGWVLMLVAMMLPTQIQPINHIIERSFRRRRVRSLALFFSGYIAVWMLAGCALHAARVGLGYLLPGLYFPVLMAAFVTAVWQCSPVKQRSLNRCHKHAVLAAFGRVADRDVLQFGILHGTWCVGSCWALMFLAMMIPSGHHFAMVAATFLMVSERLEVPKMPGWHLRGSTILWRMIKARIQTRVPVLLPVHSTTELTGK